MPRYNANFTSDSEKKKYLFCDGSTYNTTAYPKLYKVLGTNKLPKLNDGRVLWGSSAGGTYIEAGLPNISGAMGGTVRANESHTTGSFIPRIVGYLAGLPGGGPNDIWVVTTNLDASKSSQIYGRSSTVQPPAMTVRFYIRAK